MLRSGSGCLNNFPRFISGLRAHCKQCKVVHGDQHVAAAGNSGRTGDFTLVSLFLFGQQGSVRLLGRDFIQVA
jgi:hypothetical protein